MRRVALGLALLAATAIGVGAGTESAFTQTQSNPGTVRSQTVFPPLNTSAPVATPTTVTGVIVSVSGSRGSWTTVDPSTSTYTLQWQRCASGTCTDIDSPLVLDVNNLLGTLVHTVIGADSGKTLRLKVTGADSAITASGDRASTVAYSSEVAIP